MARRIYLDDLPDDPPLSSRPRTAEPDLTERLTELTDDELITLLARFTNWSGYAGGVVAQLAGAERKAEERLSLRQARVMTERAEKTVAAQKAAVAADPAVQEAVAAVTDIYEKRLKWVAWHDELESKGRVVSRDLTRRTASRDVENRAAKWGT